MPTLLVKDREGLQRAVEGQSGLSVMEILHGTGFDELRALCGGCCSCATCYVYVDAAFTDKLPSMSDDESELLDGSAHRRPASRLACQIPFGVHVDGMLVEIAPED